MYYQRDGQDAHLQRLQKDGSVVVDEAGVALRVARDGAQLLLLQRRIAYKTGEHRDIRVFLILCALPSRGVAPYLLGCSLSKFYGNPLLLC